MASALPAGMDEDRVAAMSAALLSLGERAAEGLGRGELSQVYVEGENGNVFLVSADDEAVLVAVAAKGAKVGMMLFEIRRAAKALGAVLRVEPPADWPSRSTSPSRASRTTEPAPGAGRWPTARAEQPRPSTPGSSSTRAGPTAAAACRRSGADSPRPHLPT